MDASRIAGLGARHDRREDRFGRPQPRRRRGADRGRGWARRGRLRGPLAGVIQIANDRAGQEETDRGRKLDAERRDDPVVQLHGILSVRAVARRRSASRRPLPSVGRRRVDQGNFDNVDLAGINLGLMMDLQAIIRAGNWTAALLVDDEGPIQAVELGRSSPHVGGAAHIFDRWSASSSSCRGSRSPTTRRATPTSSRAREVRRRRRGRR